MQHEWVYLPGSLHHLIFIVFAFFHTLILSIEQHSVLHRNLRRRGTFHLLMQFFISMLVIFIGLWVIKVAVRSSLEVGKYLILDATIWYQTVPTIYLASTSIWLLDLRLWKERLVEMGHSVLWYTAHVPILPDSLFINLKYWLIYFLNKMEFKI